MDTMSNIEQLIESFKPNDNYTQNKLMRNIDDVLKQTSKSLSLNTLSVDKIDKSLKTLFTPKLSNIESYLKDFIDKNTLSKSTNDPSTLSKLYNKSIDFIKDTIKPNVASKQTGVSIDENNSNVAFFKQQIEISNNIRDSLLDIKKFVARIDDTLYIDSAEQYEINQKNKSEGVESNVVKVEEADKDKDNKSASGGSSGKKESFLESALKTMFGDAFGGILEKYLGPTIMKSVSALSPALIAGLKYGALPAAVGYAGYKTGEYLNKKLNEAMPEDLATGKQGFNDYATSAVMGTVGAITNTLNPEEISKMTGLATTKMMYERNVRDEAQGKQYTEIKKSYSDDESKHRMIARSVLIDKLDINDMAKREELLKIDDDVKFRREVRKYLESKLEKQFTEKERATQARASMGAPMMHFVDEKAIKTKASEEALKQLEGKVDEYNSMVQRISNRQKDTVEITPSTPVQDMYDDTIDESNYINEDNISVDSTANKAQTLERQNITKEVDKTNLDMSNINKDVVSNLKDNTIVLSQIRDILAKSESKEGIKTITQTHIPTPGYGRTQTSSILGV